MGDYCISILCNSEFVHTHPAHISRFLYSYKESLDSCQFYVLNSSSICLISIWLVVSVFCFFFGCLIIWWNVSILSAGWLWSLYWISCALFFMHTESFNRSIWSIFESLAQKMHQESMALELTEQSSLDRTIGNASFLDQCGSLNFPVRFKNYVCPSLWHGAMILISIPCSASFMQSINSHGYILLNDSQHYSLPLTVPYRREVSKHNDSHIPIPSIKIPNSYL